ncbi:MAG: FKBP-type peptidyl-prolyl cis-trans isomerase [Paludibacteraceae bacterium]|nr:FKBP-type peptidyl-prolyl cis-trans isomerase [Paludibacteraceae bacterium]
MNWREENEAYMASLAEKDGYEKWPGGVYGKFLAKAETGTDAKKPRFDSVVTCHYTGRLINGKVFDDSRAGGVPAAFRVRELISGFQIGLTHMRAGDKIEVYIPWAQGYGNRACGADIPAYSTLIFEIELLSIN